MTGRRNTPPPSEAAARRLAEKGIAGLEQVQVIVDRAHEMLATCEVARRPLAMILVAELSGDARKVR